MPISNSYRTFNPDGTTDPAGSFAYWTDPVFDTAATPSPGHDTNPSMVYSPVPPATAKNPPAPNTITPAPWVPFTRAGCDVGGTATANMIPENTGVDMPKVFGPNSPEAQQLAADSDSFKNAETADYVGIGVHCARGSTFCADAQGVKFGQSTPSPTAVSDVLPDEPGGYQGYQALFGHRYVAPQLGAGSPNVSRGGYQVTNGAGNLVDEDGNQINGAFLTNHRGFPGFSAINASQTLAYMADMQESGISVTYGYISDIHGNEHIPGVTACQGAPAALGSGSACYVARRSTTTMRSQRSSSAWPRTGSRRGTRCSPSAPTKAITRPGPTWAGRSSPRRRVRQPDAWTDRRLRAGLSYSPSSPDDAHISRSCALLRSAR
jgi:hypothetical protein